MVESNKAPKRPSCLRRSLALLRSVISSLFIMLTCLSLQGSMLDGAIGDGSIGDGGIVEINDLVDFKKSLESLDKHSLVLFDIDYTLLVPCDIALLPCGHYLRKQYLHGLDQKRCEHLQSIIALESEERVTDLEFLTLIKQLQEKQIPVMGLTALDTGSCGNIQHLEDWRLSVLKKLGIDFSTSYNQKNPTTFQQLPQKKGSYPLFKDGVLFTNRQAKGPVLAVFLELLEPTPNKIVVIDDSLRYLKSIQQATHAKGIACLCFHYRAAQKLGKDFNESVGKFQFQYLVDHEHWLSDKQAESMIKQTSI